MRLLCGVLLALVVYKLLDLIGAGDFLAGFLAVLTGWPFFASRS